ncbi:SnaRE domain-containing protein [Cardiosporidium cionae]|uniref:SnaRE domain-containing protein n=1 Tax=Cardiosporidium cionae TaxID=476202 RepID=A0ABQ7JE34_9APIC|nr:SnaRE domain-containing protein [Cardiosporidium cionae]|eukprot:KAF8822213.1 SnaRE domain-containing protein [Cardiosporidium cionae]
MNSLNYWMRDYHRANKLAERIKELMQSQQGESQSAQGRAMKAAATRGLLAELNEQIVDLESSLHHWGAKVPTSQTFSTDQIESLRLELYTLKKKHSELQNTCKFATAMKSNGSEENSLVNPYLSTAQQDVKTSSQENGTLALFSTISDLKVVELQERMYYYQDQQLDYIQGKVGTIKNVTNKIGDEIELQGNIINEVTQKIDSAQMRITRTRRLLQWAQKRDGSTCFLVILLLILIVTLILVSVLLK